MAISSTSSSTNKPSLRVVMIDDRRDSRLPLERFLTRLGHEVQSASDAATGITLVLEFQPHLVICDIGLPDMDGYEVAQRLRQQESETPMKLVALTGRAEPEDRQQALAAGFDEHLVKPVNLDQLERLLETL
ncbi:response regulator [Aeoliella sp. SH292]|uniref:response regulator n=1 Tax=Aeoliella sp. SH292 TaxID=3454464 RepID=UPI003F9DC902